MTDAALSRQLNRSFKLEHRASRERDGASCKHGEGS